MKEYFEVLGLDCNADLETIKKRYRELVKKYHPDINKNADSSIIKKINEAYNMLVRNYNKNINNIYTRKNKIRKEIVIYNVYISKRDLKDGFEVVNKFEDDIKIKVNII